MPSERSIQAAKKAGLLYVHDVPQWYGRKRHGKKFIYLDSKGKIVSKSSLKQRFDHLMIPPAWKHVGICPNAKGHVQAVGYDDRGRKQYIYHPSWTKFSNTTKFHRMISFGEKLPLIRRAIDANLRKSSLCKEKVLAIVLRLLEETHMRIGNKEYASENGTFGLTTLKNKHLKITGKHLRFKFKGKSGKEWDVDIEDRRLASILKACQELPGQELFRYVDEENQVHTITSGDINMYLRQLTGEDFSAKDFRTWYGTVCALKAYSVCKPCTTASQRQRFAASINKQVAQILINTPATCRKYYIHPEVTRHYLEEDGSIVQALKKAGIGFKYQPYCLSIEEQATINILKKCKTRY